MALSAARVSHQAARSPTAASARTPDRARHEGPERAGGRERPIQGESLQASRRIVSAAGHDFGRIRATHRAPARTEPTRARGLTRNGTTSFTGRPSPLLVAHELVHVAQQQLARTAPAVVARAALEDEAETLAPRLVAGEAVDVEQPAPADIALAGSDPDKTYVSTVGIETNDPYIKNAKEFHTKWGYNPIDVGSIEEVTDDLAKSTGTLSRIRIVSHASVEGLYMQFATGGASPVMQEELLATTQAEAEQAGVTPAAGYVDSAMTQEFRDFVEKKDSALAKRLTIAKDGIADPHISFYFGWLLNRHRAKNVPGPSQADRDLIMPAIQRQVAAARTVVTSNTSVSDADLTALETIVDGRSVTWAPMAAPDALEQVFTRAKAAHEAFTSRGFAGKQTKMRARFTKDSTIEIRGCGIGDEQPYMQAVQDYFGTSAVKPAVQAPDWYQFYGAIKTHRAPDSSDATIKRYWEQWPERDNLKESFKKWGPVFAPSQKIPKDPTWQDLAIYLRAGHAVPLLQGPQLFTTKDMSEDQVVDWFTKNDQRLTKASAIKQQFSGKGVAVEAGTSAIVEWLQKNYSGDPSEKWIWPADPAWASHFKLLPGKGP